MKLSIYTSEDTLRPEVLIIATQEAYKTLSKLTIKKNESVKIPLKNLPNDFYTITLENCLISYKENTQGLLDISINGKDFIIHGDAEALDHLIYYFGFMSEAESNYYWHIDYYDGNSDVLETNISLVLQTI